MKKILFFITSMLFITGCGSSALPALTYEMAKTGTVIIVKNINDTLAASNKKQLALDAKEKLGLTTTEFAYSSIVDCTSLGYTRINSKDVKGDNQNPNTYFYADLSGNECAESNYASTKNSGTSGFVFLIK